MKQPHDPDIPKWIIKVPLVIAKDRYLPRRSIVKIDCPFNLVAKYIGTGQRSKVSNYDSESTPCEVRH